MKSRSLGLLLGLCCVFPSEASAAAPPQIRQCPARVAGSEKSLTTLTQSPRDLPVTCQADVVVAGGGVGGVAAALRAASEGLSVVLVEPRNCLGHELTTSWSAAPSGVEIRSECTTAKKLADELRRRKAVREAKFDPETCKSVLHLQVAGQPRIRVFFFSVPAGAVVEQGCVRGMVVANRAGRQVFLAKAVVDATEDACIAAAAGCEVAPRAADRFQARRLIALDPLPLPGKPLTHPSGRGWDDCDVTVGKQYVTITCRLPGSPDAAQDWSLAQAITLQKAAALGELLAGRESRFQHLTVSPEIVPLEAPEVRRRDDVHRPLGVEGLVLAWPQPSHAEANPSLETLLCSGDTAGRIAAETARQSPGWLVPAQPSESPAAPAGGPQVKELLAGPDRAVRYPTLRQEATSLPVAAKVDVLVVGGGTSGALAAIAAARQRAQVALVDVLPNLGGTSSNRVNAYYWGVPWKSNLSAEIDKPIQSGRSPSKTGLGKDPFSGEEKKVVLQDLAAKAKVRVFYRTFAAGAVLDANRVVGAVIENASGRQVILANVVVDATGHGDVAAAAGAAFEVGRPRDGFLHEAEHGPLRDALDPEDISKYYLRYPSYALSLNIRESRRIRGDYTVTLDDVLQGRRFPDVVARWRSNYDSHFPNSANEEDRAQDWIAILGLFRKPLWGDIPYRAILPAGLENILVVGKAYSATHDALIGGRMQRDLQHLGEAAGVAAAMACREKVPPRKLPIEGLQAELVRLGVLLPEELTDAHRPAANGPRIDLAATVARLGGDRALDAMVDLYLAGPAAAEHLLPLLESDDVARRSEAGLVLGMLGRRESAPLLLDRLAHKDRRTFAYSLPDASSRFSVPMYYSAVILLGRLRTREAAAPIAELLRHECPPDLASFAIVALGRIGERSTTAAIKPYLEFSKPVGMKDENMQFESHWGVQTNAARALAELGDDSGLPVLVGLLDADQSRLRNYAQCLLEQISGQSFGKDRALWQRWIQQRPTGFRR